MSQKTLRQSIGLTFILSIVAVFALLFDFKFEPNTFSSQKEDIWLIEINVPHLTLEGAETLYRPLIESRLRALSGVEETSAILEPETLVFFLRTQTKESRNSYSQKISNLLFRITEEMKSGKVTHKIYVRSLFSDQDQSHRMNTSPSHFRHFLVHMLKEVPSFQSPQWRQKIIENFGLKISLKLKDTASNQVSERLMAWVNGQLKSKISFLPHLQDYFFDKVLIKNSIFKTDMSLLRYAGLEVSDVKNRLQESLTLQPQSVDRMNSDGVSWRVRPFSVVTEGKDFKDLKILTKSNREVPLSSVVSMSQEWWEFSLLRLDEMVKGVALEPNKKDVKDLELKELELHLLFEQPLKVRETFYQIEQAFSNSQLPPWLEWKLELKNANYDRSVIHLFLIFLLQFVFLYLLLWKKTKWRNPLLVFTYLFLLGVVFESLFWNIFTVETFPLLLLLGFMCHLALKFECPTQFYEDKHGIWGNLYAYKYMLFSAVAFLIADQVDEVLNLSERDHFFLKFGVPVLLISSAVLYWVKPLLQFESYSDYIRNVGEEKDKFLFARKFSLPMLFAVVSVSFCVSLFFSRPQLLVEFTSKNLISSATFFDRWSQFLTSEKVQSSGGIVPKEEKVFSIQNPNTASSEAWEETASQLKNVGTHRLGWWQSETQNNRFPVSLLSLEVEGPSASISGGIDWFRESLSKDIQASRLQLSYQNRLSRVSFMNGTPSSLFQVDQLDAKTPDFFFSKVFSGSARISAVFVDVIQREASLFAVFLIMAVIFFGNLFNAAILTITMFLICSVSISICYALSTIFSYNTMLPYQSYSFFVGNLLSLPWITMAIVSDNMRRRSIDIAKPLKWFKTLLQEIPFNHLAIGCLIVFLNGLVLSSWWIWGGLLFVLLMGVTFLMHDWITFVNLLIEKLRKSTLALEIKLTRSRF